MELGRSIRRLVFIPQSTWGAHRHAPAKPSGKSQSGHKAPEMCSHAAIVMHLRAILGEKGGKAKVAASNRQLLALVFMQRGWKTSHRAHFRTLFAFRWQVRNEEQSAQHARTGVAVSGCCSPLHPVIWEDFPECTRFPLSFAVRPRQDLPHANFHWLRRFHLPSAEQVLSCLATAPSAKSSR